MRLIENGAIFDPESRSLVISAKVDDVQVYPDSDGRLTIAVCRLEEGIEIVHSSERLWWPV
jgi:hypothetical protein